MLVAYQKQDTKEKRDSVLQFIERDWKWGFEKNIKEMQNEKYLKYGEAHLVSDYVNYSSRPLPVERNNWVFVRKVINIAGN